MTDRTAGVADWPRIAGVVADLDGVVYRGDQPITSAVERFARWKRAGIGYCFVTNNSTRSPADVARKLNGMGVDVEPDFVMTSGVVTAEVARSRFPPGTGVFVLGEAALIHAFEAAGFRLTDVSPELVVVGLDRNLTYAKLRTAVHALLAGAAFIGTNPDPLLPTETGFDPGAGTIVTAVATAAGRSPLIVGKPEPLLVEAAVRRLGTDPGATLMIGDQVSTDIQCGRRAGLFSVLVRTGVPERPAENLLPPDRIVDTLAEIPD